MADSSGDRPRDKGKSNAGGSRGADDAKPVVPSSNEPNQSQDAGGEESRHKVTSLKSDRIGHTLDTRTLSSEDAQLLRTITSQNMSLLGDPSTSAQQLLATLDVDEMGKPPAAEAKVVETVESVEQDEPPAAKAPVTETVDLADQDKPPAPGAPTTETVELLDKDKPPTTDPRLTATLDGPAEGAPVSPDVPITETADLSDTGKPSATDPGLAATLDGPADSSAQIMETADLSDQGKPPASVPGLAATLDGQTDSGAQIMETADLSETGKPPTSDPRLAATLDKIGGAVSISETIGRSVDSDTANLERGSQAKTWHQLVIQPRQLITGEEADTTEGADYEVDKMLGKGAMGVVFAARQTSISRSVAVKMLKAKRADDKKQRDQFLAEAVVTGDLDHPNIVPIYDLAKTQDGALFYSMKHVKGTPWDKAIGERTIEQNLAVWLDVADAMAFAQDRGVVHRDLKPENIMLGDYGEVLVMDWGMAVSRDMLRDPRIRESSGLGGTPAYMAPEMAVEAPLHRITHKADVYLMGSMLFEIIAGAPPHRGRDVLTCVLAAARNEIVPTEETGELMDIAMKAMATKPEDRYPSVKDLQAAVRVYLSHTESNKMVSRAEESMQRAKETLNYNDYQQSIAAYREALTIWEDNDRAQAGLETVSVACAQRTLQTGDLDLGLSVLDSEKPDHMPLIRKLNFKRRVRQGVRLFIFILIATIIGGTVYGYMRIQEQISIARENESDATQQSKIANQRAEEADLAKQAAQEAQAKTQENAAAATKSARQALVAADRAEAASYRSRIALAASQIDANVFNRANAEMNGIIGQWKDSELLDPVPWEFTRLHYMLGLSEHTVSPGYVVHGLASDRDPQGHLFAFGGKNKEVEIWKMGDGAPVKEMSVTTEYDEVSALAFVKDGDALQLITVSNATVGAIGQAKYPTDITVWDVGTGDEVRKYDLTAVDSNQEYWITSVDAYREPDGLKLLVTLAYQKPLGIQPGTLQQAVHILAEDSQTTVLPHQKHINPAWDAAISPDGDLIVSGDDKGIIRVLAKVDGSFTAIRKDLEGLEFSPHTNKAVYAIRFSPDGKYLATAGGDGRVLIWDVAALKDVETFKDNASLPRWKVLRHTQAVRCIDYRADGKRLVTGCEDGAVRVWDVEIKEEDAKVTGGVAKVTEEEDDKVITEEEAEMLVEFRGHSDTVRSCLFSPFDSDIVLSGAQDGEVRVWSVSEYREYLTLESTQSQQWSDVYGATFSPDGGQVATLQGIMNYGAAAVYGLDTSDEKLALAKGGPRILQEGHTMPISHVVSSQYEGKQELLTIGIDGFVRIWDADTGSQIYRLSGVSGNPGDSPLVAASADGRWMITAASSLSSRVAAHVWDREKFGDPVDAKSAQTLGGRSVDGQAIGVAAVAVSKTGSLIFTGDQRGLGILWERGADDQFTEKWRLPSLDMETVSAIASARFTSDESRLLCTVRSRLYQFDVQTKEEIREGWLRQGRVVKSWALSGAGDRLLAVCGDGSIALVDMSQRESPELARFEMPQTQGGTQPQIRKVAISPDGKAALLLTSGKTWRLDLAGLSEGSSDVLTEMTFTKANGQPQKVTSFAFGADSSEIVTAESYEAALWDTSEDQPEAPTRFLPSLLAQSARFSSDQTLLVTTHTGDNARIWDVNTGRVVCRLTDENKNSQKALCAVFDPDRGWVYTGDDQGVVDVWDVTDGSWIGELCQNEGTGSTINGLAVSPTGTYLVTACSDNTARVWDLAVETVDGTEVPKKQPKPRLTLEGHTASVRCVDVSADGRWIITGSEDEVAKIWDAETDQDPATSASEVRATGSGIIGSVAFSPWDQRRAIIGCADGSAQVLAIRYETAGADETTDVEGATSSGESTGAGEATDSEEASTPGDTSAPADAPDAEEPPSPKDAPSPAEIASPDDTASPDDATAPEEIVGVLQVVQVLTLREHNMEVTSVMFSKDGRNVLTAGRDNRIIVWPSVSVDLQDTDSATASVLEGG